MDYIIQNDMLKISLDQDIDHASVMLLRPHIEDLIFKHKPAVLVLDMGKVEFMDSAGIGFIIGRYKSMKKAGGRLQIANAKSKILKILHMACIEHLVKIN